VTWRELAEAIWNNIPINNLDDEVTFLEPYDDKAAHGVDGVELAKAPIYASDEQEYAGSTPIVERGMYYLY
jgi:hypothetical protein